MYTQRCFRQYLAKFWQSLLLSFSGYPEEGEFSGSY
jgi:hypothetical protein